MNSNPLNQLVRQSGLTREQICAEVGIGRNTLDRLLRPTGLPVTGWSLTTADYLARYFGHRVRVIVEPIEVTE